MSVLPRRTGCPLAHRRPHLRWVKCQRRRELWLRCPDTLRAQNRHPWKHSRPMRRPPDWAPRRRSRSQPAHQTERPQVRWPGWGMSGHLQFLSHRMLGRPRCTHSARDRGRRQPPPRTRCEPGAAAATSTRSSSRDDPRAQVEYSSLPSVGASWWSVERGLITIRLSSRPIAANLLGL
jgi:hypothetical protein